MQYSRYCGIIYAINLHKDRFRPIKVFKSFRIIFLTHMSLSQIIIYSCNIFMIFPKI